MSGEEEGREELKHWHWHTGKKFGGTQRETQELKQEATTLLLKSNNLYPRVEQALRKKKTTPRMDVVLDYGNCCYTYMTKGGI